MVGLTMTAQQDGPQPYSLAPAFERTVVVLACTQPRFYGRIGHAIDPACLNNDAARLAMGAAHAIFHELGRGPDSSLVLLQRLHNLRADGKVAIEQISSVVDMFDDVEDAGLPNVESVVNELVPVLRERIRREATEHALQQHGTRGDLSRVVELEQEATRLGVADVSIGTIVGDASFDDIRALRKLTRLRTGVTELDVALKGGLQRAGLGVVMGRTGDGKSMFLSHVAGVSANEGHVVAAVTLELPKAIWNARVIANMTGIPIDALLSDEDAEERAKQLLGERTGGGFCVVHQMSSVGTTVDHIVQWVSNVEHITGRVVDVVIVDYLDKLAAPLKDGKERGSYDAGKMVCEELRAFAETKNVWCWSASQAQGRDRKKRMLDHSDTADSIQKPRIADLWLTQMVSDEQEEVNWFIAKHRTAKGRIPVGPLPTDFECGRVAPITEAT